MNGVTARRLLTLLAVLSAASQSWANQQACRRFGLFIGVSKFDDLGRKWLDYAHRDAERVETAMRRAGGTTPAVLADRSAKVGAIRQHLRTILLEATPNDHVYIFISSPGISDGQTSAVVFTYRGTAEDPGSTCLTGDEIDQVIRLCRGKVFFLLDTCRTVRQDGLGVVKARDNVINADLSTLIAAHSGKATALLASSGKRTSGEFAQLSGGHGLFADSVAAQFASHNDSGFEAFRQAVTKTVKQQATLLKRPQVPTSAGPDFSMQCRTSPRAPPSGFALLAAMRPFGAVLAPQGAAAQAVRWLTLKEQIDKVDAAESVELAQAVTRGELLTAQASQRDIVSAALEDRGNDILARYHIGDRFPEDPTKPGAESFRHAAALFEEAARFRPSFRADLEPLLRTDRLNSLMHYSRGRALAFHPASHDAAIKELLAAGQGIAGVHNTLGLIHSQRAVSKRATAAPDSARYDSAIGQFQQAISLAPVWAYPRHNLALTYIEAGEYANAEREYREAILRTPYYAYLYTNLGVLLHRLNRLDDAAEEYEKAIGVFKHQILMSKDRAQQLTAAGNIEDASYYTKRTGVLKRYHAEAYNALGALRNTQRKRGDAIEQFRLALAIDDPAANITARFNLATVLLNQHRAKRDPKKLSEAEMLLQENIRLVGTHVQSRFLLARTYARDGRHEAAKIQLERVINDEPKNIRAQAELKRVLGDIAGRADSGLACIRYQEAFDLLPLFGEPVELRQYLKQKLKDCKNIRISIP